MQQLMMFKPQVGDVVMVALQGQKNPQEATIEAAIEATEKDSWYDDDDNQVIGTVYRIKLGYSSFTHITEKDIVKD